MDRSEDPWACFSGIGYGRGPTVVPGIECTHERPSCRRILDLVVPETSQEVSVGLEAVAVSNVRDGASGWDEGSFRGDEVRIR